VLGFGLVKLVRTTYKVTYCQ